MKKEENPETMRGRIATLAAGVGLALSLTALGSTQAFAEYYKFVGPYPTQGDCLFYQGVAQLQGADIAQPCGYHGYPINGYAYGLHQ